MNTSIRTLRPWKKWPQIQGSLAVTILIPIDFSREALCPKNYLKAFLIQITHEIRQSYHDNCEIFILPYCPKNTSPQEIAILSEILEELSLENFYIFPLEDSPNREMALAQGILQSKGKLIISTNFENSSDFSFVHQALKKTNRGVDLIRGSRRLSESSFDIPVTVLPFIYHRHLLSKIFHFFIRKFFFLKTSDLGSGCWVAKRNLALRTILHGYNSGILLELEMELVAKSYGYKTLELPLAITINQEKSVTQIISEIVEMIIQLPQTFLRFYRNFYAPTPKIEGVTADDWGMSKAINEAILDLVQKGVVQRVSILANGPYVKYKLDELKKVGAIQYGLHFNMTYGDPSFSSVKRFSSSWIFSFGKKKRELSQRVIKTLEEQIQNFQQLELPITYFDAHEHVHLIPGVLKEVKSKLIKNNIQYVRFPFDRSLFLSVKAPILALCLIVLKEFQENEYSYRPFFYPSKKHFLDPNLLRSHLIKRKNHEVLVHPALRDGTIELKYPDPYQMERVDEYLSLRMLSIL